MAHLDWAVEGQLGLKTAEAILKRPDLLVVPCREIFELHPADPTGGKATFSRTR